MTQWRIRQAVAAMRAGGVVAYPTEAVWGLGCDPADPEAFATVLAMKRRPLEKGVILIAAEPEQLRSWLADPSPEVLGRLAAPRPVPTTWLVEAARGVPPWITGGRDRVAVRVTRHPVARALCAAFGGPVVSTSANPAGLPPARDALRVRCYFRGWPLLLVPGPLGGALRPSEIRDLKSGEVVRPGG
ncbi:MAG: threonylcarbamoyl-AMP synthase [Porticoccaceae bacterium]|nr:MAG: threonylcarbamoyl-AMP synthase [Porticoccaceae bacterium]